MINLLLTKLAIENLINLLLGKFELSLSFDNSYQMDYVDFFTINFIKKLASYSQLTSIMKKLMNHRALSPLENLWANSKEHF